MWCYSGGGYSIVQLLMVEASKQPFDRCTQTAVLDRLGRQVGAPFAALHHILAWDELWQLR